MLSSSYLQEQIPTGVDPAESEKIVDALVGILFDQIHHPLKTGQITWKRRWWLCTDLGHDGLALGIFDVSERHLSPFVLVDHDLRVVGVGDLLEGDYDRCQWPPLKGIV